MIKYLRRFVYKYSYQIFGLGTVGIFVITFYKPLYFFYFTTQTKEFLESNINLNFIFQNQRLFLFLYFILKDPKRLKEIKEAEERKEKILDLKEKIANSEDAEEKKKFEKELHKIHFERRKYLSQRPF